MDLAEIWRVMCKRWYIVLPGLLVTAALTVGVYVGVPTKYQSQATVGLLNSEKATQAFDGNPFLSTQTSLTGLADVLARSINSDASITELRARGLTGTSVAAIADNAQGPLMTLTVTGTDPAAVLASDTLLVTYTDEQLQKFQANQSVSPIAMIRILTVVPPQNPAPQTKTKIEYLAIAALLGIAASLTAAFFLEARRRPRPSVRTDDELDDLDGGDADDPEPDAVPLPAGARRPERPPAGAGGAGGVGGAAHRPAVAAETARARSRPRSAQHGREPGALVLTVVLRIRRAARQGVASWAGRTQGSPTPSSPPPSWRSP